MRETIRSVQSAAMKTSGPLTKANFRPTPTGSSAVVLSGFPTRGCIGCTNTVVRLPSRG